jgi:transcriptional regulator with XRE-family HTH domain
LNRVKNFRQEQNITLKQLSEMTGIAIGYICDIENDEDGKKNPTRDVMQRIADALGKTVPEVFFPEN